MNIDMLLQIILSVVGTLLVFGLRGLVASNKEIIAEIGKLKMALLELKIKFDSNESTFSRLERRIEKLENEKNN